MAFIYQLVDPIYSVPFYVGQTIKLDKRLEQHIAEAAKHANARRHIRYLWINQIVKGFGSKPVIQTLASGVSNADIYHLEAFWMLDRLAEGYPLTNFSYWCCSYYGVSRQKAKHISHQNLFTWASSVSDSVIADVIINRYKKQFADPDEAK